MKPLFTGATITVSDGYRQHTSFWSKVLPIALTVRFFIFFSRFQNLNSEGFICIWDFFLKQWFEWKIEHLLYWFFMVLPIALRAFSKIKLAQNWWQASDAYFPLFCLKRLIKYKSLFWGKNTKNLLLEEFIVNLT